MTVVNDRRGAPDIYHLRNKNFIYGAVLGFFSVLKYLPRGLCTASLVGQPPSHGSDVLPRFNRPESLRRACASTPATRPVALAAMGPATHGSGAERARTPTVRAGRTWWASRVSECSCRQASVTLHLCTTLPCELRFPVSAMSEAASLAWEASGWPCITSMQILPCAGTESEVGSICCVLGCPSRGRPAPIEADRIKESSGRAAVHAPNIYFCGAGDKVRQGPASTQSLPQPPSCC